MGKISIGLRGWRFDEAAVFDGDGEFRPLAEMPADDRRRLLRLVALVQQPCDACYLRHGEADVGRCREATAVYGEPEAEVLLCDEHETDFVYWYREAGGRAHRGEASLPEAFHGWFEAGGRAPEGYDGLEHVHTDPDALPDPPTQAEVQARLDEGFEPRRVTVVERGDRDPAAGTPGEDTPDPGSTEVDLDVEYPGG